MVDTGETQALVALLRAVRSTGYAFVTPTPATHARVLARPGTEWARDLRDVFGWSRPFPDGLLPANLMDAMRATGILAPHGPGWRSLLRVSTLDGMAFLHSAYPTQDADSVFFGPDTYRFAAAIRRLPRRQVRRAVDVGCGAGPGAVLLSTAYPDAEIVGVDINPAALRLARANAAAAQVTASFAVGDVLQDVPAGLDVVVANPPYMADPARRAYRDGGGPLGSALSLRILDDAIERLAPGGLLLLYTGAAVVNGVDPFHNAAAARLSDTGLDWRYSEVDPDVFGEELDGGAYARADRIAAVVLTVQKPGGDSPCPTAS